MYKLILSNNKQLGRIYSNGVIVWEMKSSENGLRMFEKDVFFTSFGAILNMRGLPDLDDFDYFEHRGVRINSSDINRISSSLSRVTSPDLAEAMGNNRELGVDITIKFYKRAPGTQETPAEPEPPVVEAPPTSKQHFATENIEFFNAISYILVTRIGSDWDSFEVEGVEVSKSDGYQSYKDFTINNRDKIAEVQRATSLSPYGIGRFDVKKYRAGVTPAPEPQKPETSNPPAENSLPPIPGRREVVNYVEMDRKTEFAGVITYQTSAQLSRGNYHLYIQSSKDMQVNITFEKIGAWGATDIVYEQNRVRTNQEIEIDVNTLHSFTQISIHSKELSTIQQVVLSSDRIIE